ncbi:MAG: AMP-binding protein [Clostridia bacterium]
MELYEKYIKETIDEFGHLTDISFNIPENFNFAFDIIDYYGRVKPNKVAMIWIADDKSERKFTFKDISEYSSMTANYFKSLGIKKGDKVLLILRRHYQFWFSILALHKLGAVAIPATDQLMKKDLVYRINLAEVKAVICSSSGTIATEVEKAVADCGQVKVKVITGCSREGWRDFDSEMATFPSTFLRPEGHDATSKSDTMVMFFTSGTTGYPKLAIHDYTYAIAHFTTAKWWHNVNVEGLHLTVADTGWGKALWGKLYGQWILSAPIFVYDFTKFNADDLLTLIQKYRITTFCAPPTIYRFFIKEDLSKYDLSSLQYVTTAGEALNPEVFKQLQNATGLKLMEGFGQTETSLTLANLIGATSKPGSMGKPNPQYKIRLITSEGNLAVAGEVGEVCIDVSVPPVGLFKGYYHDEVNTNAVIHDGVYHTGDMAWFDEDGYYWFVGRTDDLIKSSGYRIGPFEIESVIMEYPSVLECAVTGVPDPVRGQIVKATIVLIKGVEGTEELKKEIQTYVKHATAPYKYPRVIEFVSELPKTISGKIKRTEIRKGSESANT